MSAIASRCHIVSATHLKQLAQSGELLFEGAQGVLLDEWYGFHPHTTWSTTTFANAESLLLEIGHTGPIERVGVLRSYFTRHGAGPFPTYVPELAHSFAEVHNGNVGWQGEFRRGWFDEVLARYAVAVCGRVDALAITHLDQIRRMAEIKVASFYRQSDGTVLRNIEPKRVLADLEHQESLARLLDDVVPIYDRIPSERALLGRIEDSLGVPIRILSHGPTATDKECHARVAFLKR